VIGPVVGYVALNTMLKTAAMTRATKGTPVKPPYKVSIIMPAWHEPDEFLEAALRSLREQNVVKAFPEMFEIIVVDGVSNKSIVMKYADRLLKAPEGKMRARDYGIRNASGEIIVAVDADCVYPPNWLNEVLKPFHDPNVVGVATPTDFGALDLLVKIPVNILYSAKMLGRGSAFLKSAYFKIGGFPDVDEHTIGSTDEIAIIEEFEFMKRLRQVGEVVFVDVPHIHLGGEVTKGRGFEARGIPHGYPRGVRQNVNS